MPRKPTETVQVNLRMKEADRRRLAQAAEKRGVSLNAEMLQRLKESFDQEAARSLDETAQKLEAAAMRLESVSLTIPSATLTLSADAPTSFPNRRRLIRKRGRSPDEG